MKVFSLIKEYLIITFGCMLAAVGISCFLLPNHLSSGGFAGIATVLNYLFKWKMGNTIMMLNIPLFIIGYFRCGKKFILKSLYSTFLYSKLIDMFSNRVWIQDKFLASVYGGIFIGTGLALVFKADSSTGGTDLIAYIVQDYKLNIKMSSVITIIDFFIIVVNIIVFKELEVGFYSFLVIYILGKMIDIVFEGINFCKVIYIISDKYEEIMQMINLDIKRGATGLYGKGSFTQNDKTIIMCVSKRRDIDKIKDLSQKIDPYSFIIITDAREVYGLGFKR